jgi:hypothetical protein
MFISDQMAQNQIAVINAGDRHFNALNTANFGSIDLIRAGQVPVTYVLFDEKFYKTA